MAIKRTVLLYSGGMDSLIAHAWYHEPETLYVDLGTKYSKVELEIVKRTLPDTTIISIPEMGRFELEDAHFPGRNSLLAWCGASVGAERIILVTQKGEMDLRDRNRTFFRQISHHLSYVFERNIVVETPFFGMDKTDMVEWFIKSGGDLSKLMQTIGCYSGGAYHCGNCPACLRRYVALMNNGIDPNYVLMEEIKRTYRKKLKDYPKHRQERMKRWLT